MNDSTFAPLEITSLWARVNDELIELVDAFPDDKLDWSPDPKLWNSRGILLHIVLGRNFLMEVVVKDGNNTPEFLQAGQSTDGLKEQLRLSWERMRPFLSDAAMLAKDYKPILAGERRTLTGHWLAYGQLEHDIHHRADIYRYLGLLGIAHDEPDTLERASRTEP